MIDTSRENIILDPIHIRKTGEFVIGKVNSFDQLYDPNGRFNERFLGVLGGLLPSSDLRPFRNMGGVYSKLFQPYTETGNGVNVAVKLFDKKLLNRLYYPPKVIPEDKVKEIFEQKDFILFTSHDTPPTFDELSKEEKSFVGLAAIHRKFEKLYPGYILPSLFVAYKTEKQIIGEKAYHSEIEELQKEDRLNSDGRRILYKPGESVFSMVQDIQNLRGPVIYMKPTDITETDKQQVSAFIEKLEDVYEREGVYPDVGKAKFHDLYFNDKGRLVFIDTNQFGQRSEIDIVNWPFRSAVDNLREVITSPGEAE